MNIQLQRPILAVSEERVRKWLEFTPTQWDELTERQATSELEAIVPEMIELEERLAQLKFVFKQLGEQDLTTKFTAQEANVTKLKQLVIKRVTNRSASLDPLMDERHRLTKLLDRLSTNEAKTIVHLRAALVDNEPDSKVAGLFSWATGLLGRLKESWPKIKDVVVDRWSKTLKQLDGELGLALNAIQQPAEDVVTATKRQLLFAHSKLVASNNSTILADRIHSLANEVEHRAQAKFGQYLEDVKLADVATLKFVLVTLGNDDPRVATLRTKQNPDKPVLYCAKVRDELIITSLKRFRRVKKRGKYSYNVYEINGDHVLLYDDWMISNTSTPLQAISSGAALTQKAAITFKFRQLNASQPKVAAVLRATFTSNARFDEAFMDFMRSLDAMKIGPNTWDIPVKTSADIERLKAQLKQDWGYPFIYENVETPSVLYQLYDTMSSGVTSHASVRWASLVRVVYTNKPVQLKKSDVEQRLAILNKVVTAAQLSTAHHVTQRLCAIANNLHVVEELLVADKATMDTGLKGAANFSPDLGSSVVIGGAVYWIAGVRVSEPYGWLDVEDAKGMKYVVTCPDLNSNIALLKPAVYEKIKDRRSVTANTVINVPKGSLHAMPTFVVVNIDGEEFIIDPQLVDEVERGVNLPEGEDESPCAEPRATVIKYGPEKEPSQFLSKEILDRYTPNDLLGDHTPPEQQTPVSTPIDRTNLEQIQQQVLDLEDSQTDQEELKAIGPLGGQPGIHHMNPSIPGPGLPVDWATQEEVLNYPTPTGRPQFHQRPFDIEHYRRQPVDIDQERPVVRIITDPDKVPDDEKRIETPPGIPLGPHPDAGFDSSTEDGMAVTVFDPLMQMRQRRNVGPWSVNSK